MHSHDCPPAIVPVLGLHILSHLVLATTGQETGVREPSNLPKVTQLGLEWNPGLSHLQSCVLSAGPHRSPGASAFWRWTRSGSSYDSASLSAGNSCPRSGRQLLPLSRTGGSEARQGFICSFLPWLLGSLAGHARPPPPPLGKGCCTWYYPGCLWNARVSVMLSGFRRSHLPHCTWPRLVLRFICILCALAWQMVGEEAGCLLGAAARDQAGSQGPQSRMPTHWAP